MYNDCVTVNSPLRKSDHSKHQAPLEQYAQITQLKRGIKIMPTEKDYLTFMVVFLGKRYVSDRTKNIAESVTDLIEPNFTLPIP